MKKRIAIVVCLILALILLTPIPMRLKDGGTVEYNAILYQVHDVHRINPDVNAREPFIEGIVIKILGSTVFDNVKTGKENGSTPFLKLSAEDISKVTVGLYPPNTVTVLSDKQIEELVQILNRSVIYDRDDTYTQYCGQGVVYTIEKKDGEIVEVNAFNPFIIIDGEGYRTEYESCDELSAFGNRVGGN